MENDITLDVRGLEPPEPLEQALEALSQLGKNQRLRMLIDREPYPLYPILVKRQFMYNSRTLGEHRYEITIWHQP